MKTFSALNNNPEFQAARLGLVRGNDQNRGSWYDRKTGEFVAKTVGGSLEFYNKGQRSRKAETDLKLIERKNSLIPHTLLSNHHMILELLDMKES